MEQENNVLYARMLGGFSMTWNGRSITENRNQRESQFTVLMQALLHHRQTGVSRNELIELLFGERDVENASHSLQVLLYTAKRKLRAAGLPDCAFFESTEGGYRWTREIPVREDATEFERSLRLAETEEDPEAQLPLYHTALRLYTGDFLPLQAGVLWVAAEARRYRELFAAGVESVAELLRERESYEALEDLGRYTSRIQPFCTWEKLTLEALIGQERFSEAQALYADTRELYLREIQAAPAAVMEELLAGTAVAGKSGPALLDGMMTRLTNAALAENKPHLSGYSEFRDCFRLARRSAAQPGVSASLMLCSLEDPAGQAEAAEAAILREVWKQGAVRRCGRGQYLALLVQTDPAGCAAVQQRIDAAIPGATLRYYVRPLL